MDWSGRFESIPSIKDEHKYGARVIRQMKEAILEREELEHNFVDGAPPFHKAGQCSVMLLGTTEEINDFTDMVAGCIAFDTTLGVMKRYSGAVWEDIASSHSDLSGLVDDDHLQYLNLTRLVQELKQSLALDTGVTIDGRDIGADYTALDSLILVDTGPVPLHFVFDDNEIRRETGDFEDDGFLVGDIIYCSSSANPGPFRITDVTPKTITVAEDLTEEPYTTHCLVEVREGFSEWDMGPPYVYGTAYGPVTNDCLIAFVNYRDTDTGTLPQWHGYTDSGVTPTTFAASCHVLLGAYGSFIMPVKAGDYWRVVLYSGSPSHTPSIYKIDMES